ncbi:hypothetical protein E2C01_084997 [Portunus trituberculatus]|uniref:Uncharacterized protein n=1 Tax=Portunus trituberculatus TaxID=210409 RepID=A0A5B7IZS9_PORTR|nr:hypothetical protein [Portunus trituberculatus]
MMVAVAWVVSNKRGITAPSPRHHHHHPALPHLLANNTLRRRTRASLLMYCNEGSEKQRDFR